MFIPLLLVSACMSNPYREAKKYLESSTSGIKRIVNVSEQGEEIEYDYWEKLDDSNYSLKRDEGSIQKEYTINFDTEILSVNINEPNNQTIEYAYEWKNDKLVSNKNEVCRLVMSRVKRAYIVSECNCPSKTEYDKVATPKEWYSAYDAVVNPFLNTPLDFNK